MNIPVSAHALHEAAREEWLASRDAVRHRREQLLQDVQNRIVGGEDPDRDVLPALYRELAAERMVDAMMSFVVTRRDKTMVLAFVAGVAPNVLSRVLELDFDQGICGTVARTRRGIHLTDAQDSTDTEAEFARSSGVTSCVCLPLIAAHQLWGTLTFASRCRRRFDSEEIEFFEAVAQQIAIVRNCGRDNRAIRQ